MNDETRELIIIGGGPAGYTAALYAARANLEPLVIEGFAWGGQLMITSDVENYPGFADGIMGPAMMQDFRRQAERFGAEFLTDDVTKVDFSASGRSASGSASRSITSESVIVATGASARQLGLASERLLQGRGVTYCAVCDAAFFREQEVVVVGGGDSAMEEAIFLTKFATKVTLVHRRDEFRASQIMIDRARANEKIEFVTPRGRSTRCVAENGQTAGVRLRDSRPARPVRSRRRACSSRSATTRTRSSSSTSSTTTRPATSSRKPARRETNIEGVFAAGDVVDHTYRQAVTAAGTGCMSARSTPSAGSPRARATRRRPSRPRRTG